MLKFLTSSKYNTQLDSKSSSNRLSNPQVIVILLLFSAFLSVSYSYFHMYFSNNPLVLVKMCSILCLAMVIKLSDIPDNIFASLLIMAVVFHSFGDYVIEQSDYIFYSIPFFFLGHLFYIFVIFRDNLAKHRKSKYSFDKSSSIGNFIKMVLILLGFGLLVYVNYNLADYLSGIDKYLIILYSLILWTLLAVAIMHKPNFLLVIGVLCYISSDMLIAYNDFVANIELKTLFSWPLYYTSQLLIIYSLIKYQLSQTSRTLL